MGELADILDDAIQSREVQDGEVLTVLPLRNRVLFPGVILPINITRPKNRKLVQSRFEHEELILVLCQRAKQTDDPTAEDLYEIGTTARIVRTMALPDESLMVFLEGITRVRATEFKTVRGVIQAKVERFEEIYPARKDKEFLALCSTIKQQALNILEGHDVKDANMILNSIGNPVTLVNYVCVNFDISIQDKQHLLETTVVKDRAPQLLTLLAKEIEITRLQHEIQEKTSAEINKDSREYYLREQLETIQRELGNDSSRIIKTMEDRAKTKHWNKTVADYFKSELEKLRAMSMHGPDFSLQQNYLDTLLDLPWNEYTEDAFDIRHAQKILDRDHYGMEKVKERIIEYLSVLKLQHESGKKAIKSPILCLYGPPGVGKTSLGKSIAEALGRKYARVSLGGLHDEAEIRGHRRTYIGAMPGRIIQSIKKVQSSNPVFVLDEIDKIGADYKGDPTSALLEVLDPEQNNTFHDNYLDVDYDLSQVLFIATANTLDSIPRPLLDRMELIEMTGYLQEEKVQIAAKHLLPKQLLEHGLKSAQLKITKPILDRIIEDYTRESGVRSLDRTLAALCRKVATSIALGEEYNVSPTEEDLVTYLGQKKFYRDTYEGNKYVGVVTGLAWTAVGGEILYIEASLAPAKQPVLTLTGNLGDVMKESATLAMGYIRSHATELGINQKTLDTHSVHVHVPEGAVPKDGPSAGITITTALVSAITHRKVRQKIAMTGEMTLRGKVLPIGGVKEKLLAAKRAGITDLVLCHENEKDVEEIPSKYLKGLHFHYVNDIHEVLDYAIL